MSMATQRIPFVTSEEYLDFDRQSEFRNEYVFGQIVAMAGASPNHSLISANTLIAIGARLDRSKCRIYDSGLRVCVDPQDVYAYPDLTVVCGQMLFSGPRLETASNPKLVVEVLSPSTRAYDLGDKARMYTRISSMEEIVLIEQRQMRIEHWRRLQDKRWELSVLEGGDAILCLPSIGCDVPVAEIYDHVEFETTAGTDAP